MTSPDPVAQAAAYQASLLAELGDDDPAEVQAATPAAMRSLLAALECLGHLTDGELVVSGRYRWIIAEETPRIVAYDQALWVDHLRHRDDDAEGLIAAFEALRRANLALWARFGATHGDRIGMHDERGPESYDLTFRLAAGHDRLHLAQARRAREAVRNGAAGPG